MSNIMDDIYEGVLHGDITAVRSGVTAALEAGMVVEEVLNQGMIEAMTKVGTLFEEGEYFVPEMLIAARAMQAGLEILKPALMESNVEPVGKVALGTVQGDMHNIGKNLVAMMFEGAGFEVVDLGTDAPPARFVDAIQDGANIVGLSALLTTTMPAMTATIAEIEKAGLRDQVKIVVGGAPVTQEYATQIGADGFASDASSAVTVTKALLNIE